MLCDEIFTATYIVTILIITECKHTKFFCFAQNVLHKFLHSYVLQTKGTHFPQEPDLKVSTAGEKQWRDSPLSAR